jgi:hypothetical protein
MIGPMLHVTIELIMLPTKGLVLMLMKGFMLLSNGLVLLVKDIFLC